MIPPRIKDVCVLEDYLIKIKYINGEEKIYDMKKQLQFDFYKNLINKGYFALVKSVETTIEWPNGEDMDPNELYEKSCSINNK